LYEGIIIGFYEYMEIGAGMKKGPPKLKALLI
jgi:hypothetical protein